MTAKGIDFYALSLADIKSTGATFVCRYLSLTPGKILERAEAQELSKAGLDILLVWETTANRAYDGEAAGESDASTALAQAKAAGMPAGRPIFFSVDVDTSLNPNLIAPYFTGVGKVLPSREVGVYGGLSTVRLLFDLRLVGFGWQTTAWSNGVWDSRAQVRQVDYTSKGYDIDEAVAEDFGQWK